MLSDCSEALRVLHSIKKTNDFSPPLPSSTTDKLEAALLEQRSIGSYIHFFTTGTFHDLHKSFDCTSDVADYVHMCHPRGQQPDALTAKDYSALIRPMTGYRRSDHATMLPENSIELQTFCNSAKCCTN